MPDQQAIIKKQIANNPLFKGASEPKVELARTADKRDIAGHSCAKFVVKEDGKETMTAWATSYIKSPLESLPAARLKLEPKVEPKG